jgi:hypothetical protein
MYNGAHKPILLEPYERELEATLKWAKWSSFAVKDAEFVDHLLSAFDIQENAEMNDTKEIFSKLTDDDMSSVLVVATSLASSGVKRLGEIVNKLAIHGSLDNKPGSKLHLKRREKVVAITLKAFEDYFRDNSRGSGKSNSPSDEGELALRSLKAIEDNNRKDAKAFDQLLQFNEIYNKQKHMILYFSSAPKSLYLDKTTELREHYYPRIDGAPYDLVRTATDLFVYMVYKGDTEGTEQRTRAAKYRLNELEKLIGKIETIKEAFEVASKECQHCNVNTSQQRCTFGTLCDGVKKYGRYIEQREELNVNYSLQKKVAQIIEGTKSRPAEQRHREVLLALKQVLKEKVRARNQEMEVILQSSLNKADFLSTFVKPARNPKVRKVSCYLNSYPVCLTLKNSRLQSIVTKTFDLFETGWEIAAFQRYVGEYLELDIELTRYGKEDPEGELVRGFLYLLMSKAEKAKQIALRHLEGDWITDYEREEFRYLLCYVLWRLGDLTAAIKLSGVGATQSAHAGRFFHCRSLLTLSLLERGRNRAQYNYVDMVADTRRAVEEFAKDNEGPRRTEMLGVCHNNLAYYLSDPEFGSVNLAEAQAHLRELRAYIPEDRWESYSEFFHTKGCVLYQEFLSAALRKNQGTLDEAFAAADKALTLFSKKAEHVELVNIIKNTYERFKLPLPKPNAHRT